MADLIMQGRGLMTVTQRDRERFGWMVKRIRERAALYREIRIRERYAGKIMLMMEAELRGR